MSSRALTVPGLRPSPSSRLPAAGRGSVRRLPSLRGFSCYTAVSAHRSASRGGWGSVACRWALRPLPAPRRPYWAAALRAWPPVSTALWLWWCGGVPSLHFSASRLPGRSCCGGSAPPRPRQGRSRPCTRE